MVNITIYPFGNAHETFEVRTGRWNFSCQHGEPECDANMVETCFINLVEFDQTKYMDFLFAYETAIAASKFKRNLYHIAETVFNDGNYAPSWDDMKKCMGESGQFGGTTGNHFEHQMALWTKAANHKYTPWITVNGVNSKAIQDSCTKSTLECTCSAYKGTNACCKDIAEKPRDDVCWRDDL